MRRVQHVRDRVPGEGDRNRGGLRCRRSGASEIPGPVRDRLLALHLLRTLRRSLPRGRHPHGQGSARSSRVRSRPHVAFAGRSAPLAATKRCRQALSAQERAQGRCRGTKGGRMIETILLWLFAGTALAAAASMLVIRHPMRVALALTATMLSLAGVYALLGVHVIAVFQVLIYVGAVMVFMVYVIMLLDVRDRSLVRSFSPLLIPGIAAAVVFVGVFAYSIWHTPAAAN